MSSSSSSNFDPKIVLLKQIHILIEEINDHSLSDENINNRIKEIIPKINEISIRIDEPVYYNIRSLRDKLQEIGNLNSEALTEIVKKVGKTAQLIGIFDVTEQVLEYLEPHELLNLYVNKGSSPDIANIIVDLINKNKIPLHKLVKSNNNAILVNFIKSHGEKIECYKLVGDNEINLIFSVFPVEKIDKWSPNLNELSLKNSKVSQGFIEKIASFSEKLTNFKILKLIACYIEGDDLKYLNKLNNIEELDLTNSFYESSVDESLSEITIALNGLQNLTKLNLDFNHIGSADLSSFTPFMNALKMHNKLQQLNFAYNKMHATDEIKWNLLFDALGEFHELNFLDLSGNKISDLSLERLASTIGTVRKLETFRLKSVNLQNLSLKSVQALFQALAKCPIKALSLTFNDIFQTHDHLNELMRSLGTLHSLRSLDLTFNSLVMDASLISLAKKLPNIEKIYLYGNAMTPKEIAEMNREATGTRPDGTPVRDIFIG